MRSNESESSDKDNSNAGRGQTKTGRRTFVKGIAAAGAGGLLFSGRSAASSPYDVPDRIADTFGRIVDVTEAGGDNTGSESITPILDEHHTDDTLFYFPPGRYYMDEQFRFSGFENFGLYGNDATLVPARYQDFADDKHKLFRLGTWYDPGKRIVIENFDVDFTGEDTGVRAFEAVASDDLQVRDVTIHGRHDSGMWGPGRFVVRNADGQGIVERFKATGGGEWNDNTPSAGRLWRGPSGIISNTFNEGTMTFRDCELGGFPDNGLYCGGSKGQIVVDGGVYKNSNGNNVRVGGPNSVIRGVTVTVDETFPEASHHRGIRLQGTTDARIEDTTVSIEVPVQGSTGIVVMDSCDGETVIEDSSVNMDHDAFNNAIEASPKCGRFKVFRSHINQNTDGGCAVLLHGEGGDDEWAMLAKVNITGSPTNKWNRSAVYNTRNNVEFRAVSIDQTGGDKRRGITNLGDDCLLYKCDIHVNQYPVIDSGSGTWVSYNTFESYEGFEGYFLTDDSSDVYLKENVLDDGIRDDGSVGLRTVANTV